MGRGLERRRVFATDEDKRDFLERLAIELEHTQTECLAWSVMSNHYHLLLRLSVRPLSKVMAPLLGGYAAAYNRRKSRAGYVFQNRYKSILCQEETYLLELVRYIHLNPVQAKLVSEVSELDDYQWTGHATLMGRRRETFQSTEPVLSRFSEKIRSARRDYRQFISDGVKQGASIDFTGGGLVRSAGGWEGLKRLRKNHEQRIGDERILGDGEFVEHALAQDELNLEKKEALLRSGWNLDRLTSQICFFYEIDPALITTKGRANNLSLSKSLICYFAVEDLGISQRDLAEYLEMSQVAVSKAVARGRMYCLENEVRLEQFE